MQRRSWIAGVGLGLLLGQARGARTWQMATGYASDAFQTRNVKSFTDELARETAGAITVQVHDNNTLVRMADIAQAVRERRVEFGEVLLSSALPKEITAAGADAVPFLTRSDGDVKRLWACQRPVLDRQLARIGLKALYAVPWPPQCLYSSVPLAHPQDLAGLRMRTYNPSSEAIAKLLGAVAVDVATADTKQAVAEGRIDTLITSAVTGVDQALWTRMKYLYLINAWSPKNLVFMNAAAWHELGPDLQAALAQVAARAEVRGWEASADAAKLSLATLRSRGMTVDFPSASLSTALRRLGERFSREWVRTAGSDANQIFVPYYSASTQHD